MREVQPGWAWRGRDIPGHKPAFDGFFADRSGRIWVRCYGPGQHLEGCREDAEEVSEFLAYPCWRDRFWYEVFEESGRFLGRVEIPAGFQDSPTPFIEGEMVIANVEGEDSTPYVKRYRLVIPAGS